MTKSQIRRVIGELEHILNQWIQFRNFFYPDRVTAELENQFSQIRSDLTNGQQTFLSIVEFDIEIAQSMMDSMGRINTAHDGEHLTSTARKRLEEEWNSVYLLIQETIGLLEYKIEQKGWTHIIRQLTQKQKEDIPDYIMSSRHGGGIRKIKQLALFRLVFAIIVLIIIVIVLFRLGIIEQYLP